MAQARESWGGDEFSGSIWSSFGKDDSVKTEAAARKRRRDSQLTVLYTSSVSIRWLMEEKLLQSGGLMSGDHNKLGKPGFQSINMGQLSYLT